MATPTGCSGPVLLLTLLPLLAAGYQDDGTRVFRPWPPLNHGATNGTLTVGVDACNLVFAHDPSNKALSTATAMYSAVIKQQANCTEDEPKHGFPPGFLSGPVLRQISVACNETAVVPPVVGTDESFDLSVPADGSAASLAAATYPGVLRGLETFSQLVLLGAMAPGLRPVPHIPAAPWRIHDSPQFPHRGLLLDPARTFIPVTDVKSVIDGMMYSKLNVLHLHLTDSQSFPIALASRPEITQYGAQSADKVYTKADLRDLVLYAAERGVEIIPEMDSPGHARAIGLSPALKEIVACADTVPYTKHCAEPPCGQLNPASALMYSVTEGVLQEVAATFPSTSFHVGFDEINMACWQDEPSIQAYLKLHNMTTGELLLEFFQKQRAILDRVAPSKSRIAYWEEAALQDPPLPIRKGDVVQMWSDQTNLLKALNSTEADIIVSWADNVYMDCGLGNMFGDNSWCDPFKTFYHMYAMDPLKGFPAGQTHRVLGGEAAMWGEVVSPSALHPRVWPRAAAYGGRLWAYGNLLSQQETALRVADHVERLVARGVPASNVMLPYCRRFPEACFSDAQRKPGYIEPHRDSRKPVPCQPVQ